MEASAYRHIEEPIFESALLSIQRYLAKTAARVREGAQAAPIWLGKAYRSKLTLGQTYASIAAALRCLTELWRGHTVRSPEQQPHQSEPRPTLNMSHTADTLGFP